MYLPLCFKQFTNPYLLVATEHKETIKTPSKNEHSPLMGKFRFLHWRPFGNTHGACNSTFHTKQVVSFGIVGRRRWAIESHFLVVQWMDVFFPLLTVPFLTYDATFLYRLACLRRAPLCATHLSVHNEMSVTSPVRSKSHRQTVGLLLLLLMSINTQKKIK